MAVVAALARGTAGARQKERLHGAERLPRTDELVDPRIPDTLSADASPGGAPERTGPSLARRRSIGILGPAGAAVTFEFPSGH